jgi:hypothetical protein
MSDLPVTYRIVDLDGSAADLAVLNVFLLAMIGFKQHRDRAHAVRAAKRVFGFTFHFNILPLSV